MRVTIYVKGKLKIINNLVIISRDLAIVSRDLVTIANV